MRVLHVQKVNAMGGSERHLLQLLPALVAAGVDVRMAVLTEGTFPPFTQPMRDAGIETVEIPAGPDVNPMLVARLRAEILRHDPDLVHTHLLHADLHGQLAARFTRTRAVSSVHGTSWSYRRRPYRDVAGFAGRLPVRTIAISEFVSRFLSDHHLAQEERIRVVHYGLDPSAWAPAPLPDPAARRAFAIGPDDFVVGVASRLVAHKGHDVLFRAAGELHRQVPALRVLVAGVGAREQELRALAAECAPTGAISFVGYVADVRRFLAACDVVVFPTLPAFGEGFGLVALEAMASGRPVVASAIDSLPEIVVSGETGDLVPPGDVPALAASLRRLALDPGLRERLGRGGRDRMVDVFPLAAMVDGTIAVYEEALAASDRRPPLDPPGGTGPRPA